MQLTRLAVIHPVIALTATLAVAAAGLVSLALLGLERNPQLSLPIVNVPLAYPGASARIVEETETRRVEDAVSGLGNTNALLRLQSSTFQSRTLTGRQPSDTVLEWQNRVSAPMHGLRFCPRRRE